MTLHYWQYQTRKFLTGAAEELRKFHMDHDPQPTEQEALDECRSFFERQHAEYLKIANRMKSNADGVPKTAAATTAPAVQS